MYPACNPSGKVRCPRPRFKTSICTGADDGTKNVLALQQQLRPRLKDLAIGKHKSEEDGAGDTPRGRQPVRPNAPLVRGIDKRTVCGENQREFATRRAVCSRSYSVQLRAA